MNKGLRIRLLLALVCVALVTVPLLVAPKSTGDALEQARARGVLVCGVTSGARPFGFLDQQSRELTGYDVDFCKAVARRLGMTAQPVAVSVEQRIPELDSGRIDLLAAVLGWTPERARQIDYSHRYFVSRQVVIVRPESGLRSLADLQGRKVSAAKGSTAEQYLRVVAPQARLLTFQDPSSAFMAFSQGKVDAMAVTDLTAIQFRHRSDVEFATLSPPLKLEPWGLAVRKGEQSMLRAINRALEDLETSGEAAAIFDKWFGPRSDYAQRRLFTIGPIDPAQGDEAVDGGAASLLHRLPALLLRGLAITLQLFACSWLVAFGLGLSLTVFRSSGLRGAQWLVATYVELTRNIPLLAQLLFWYFAVPALLPRAAQDWIERHDGEALLAIAALGFALAGYFSEAMRSGIRAVPRTQMEAGRALGFSYLATMRHIILPQALRHSIPPLVNITVLLFQNTSIALAIGVHELMYQTRAIVNDTYLTVEVFGVTTVIYLAGSALLTFVGRSFERHFGRSEVAH
jgi:His/Glu/Gln/Arg/opine family amino acid ABC transporter permease subunit